ncbi:structural protein [Cellulophaga phage phi14:2]|uniref:Structural protein n=1 Tax=Cellulophaga phage phi14:2 TaxID=1327990 RepID=S0A0T4_9CAUD|nr:structural protein [Cellulophaga phage phi14:2]AGO48976.1 structural protein [Cellulophaga phage phi14:2]
MKITSFEISSDKSKLSLTIGDAQDVISLRLWDNDTYKDFSKLIDLSDKLTGASTETIDIFPNDLNISSFSGIYFIEAEDITETSLEFTSILNKYEECVLNQSVLYDNCEECIEDLNLNILNINTMLTSLKMALELRFINEMLNIIKALDKYCTNNCSTCGQEIDASDYENNNPDSINIILDGESLD